MISDGENVKPQAMKESVCVTELTNLEVDLEELVHEVQHSPLFGIVRCSSARSKMNSNFKYTLYMSPTYTCAQHKAQLS